MNAGISPPSGGPVSGPYVVLASESGFVKYKFGLVFFPQSKRVPGQKLVVKLLKTIGLPESLGNVCKSKL